MNATVDGRLTGHGVNVMILNERLTLLLQQRSNRRGTF